MPRSLPAWTRLICVVVEVGAGILAAATACVLFRVPELVRTNPFTWIEAGKLGATLLCAFATWGFYRFVLNLFGRGPFGSQHSGEVAWWLTGGVWVTVSLLDVSAENAAYAKFAAIQLGSLLSVPIVLTLLLRSVLAERARANWFAWLGVIAGCTVPLPWILMRWSWL